MRLVNLKAVATPLQHGRVTLHANGTVDSWREVRVDAPCQQEAPQTRTWLPHQASAFLARCELRSLRLLSPSLQPLYARTWRLGSFLRDEESLSLAWHPAAVTTHDIPCVGRGGRQTLCSLRTSTTFKRTMVSSQFRSSWLIH